LSQVDCANNCKTLHNFLFVKYNFSIFFTVTKAYAKQKDYEILSIIWEKFSKYSGLQKKRIKSEDFCPLLYNEIMSV
jgi:hypothetical protein